MGRKRKGMKGFYRGLDKEGRVAWLKNPDADEEASKMYNSVRDQILSMQDEVRATADQAVIELSHGNEEAAEELMKKGAEIYKDSERLSHLFENFPKRKKRMYDWTQNYARFQEYYANKKKGVNVNDTDGSDPKAIQAKIEGYGDLYDEVDLATIRDYVHQRTAQRERENRYESWKKGNRDVPDDPDRYTPLQRDQLSRMEMEKLDRLANGEDSIEDYLKKGGFPNVEMSQATSMEKAFMRTTKRLMEEDRNKKFDEINKFSASIYARAMTGGYKGLNNDNASMSVLRETIKDNYNDYRKWKQDNPDSSMNDYFNAQDKEYEESRGNSPEQGNTPESINTPEPIGRSQPRDDGEVSDSDSEREHYRQMRQQRTSIPTGVKGLVRRLVSMLPNVFNFGRLRITSRGGTVTGVGVQSGIFNFLVYDSQHKAAIYDGMPGSSRRSRKARQV